MEALIAICVFVSVSALMSAVLTRPTSAVQRRLQSFKGLAFAEPDGDETPTFVERVVRPVVQTLLRTFKVALPASVLQKLQWRLMTAGDPVTLTGLAVIWAISAVGLPGMFLLVVLASPEGPNSQQLLVLGALAMLGGYLPHLWLTMKSEKRQRQILKTLPDAIDLLTTSVEAGLGIDAALAQVSEKVHGPIAVELRRVLREMAMGSARRDALKAFADRSGVPDVQSFVNALIQAEQTGISLGQVIRVQADQMRMRRRQRAEEQAHKAPVKITIPLVLFFFPTILIVILGPAGIRLADVFSNNGN